MSERWQRHGTAWAHMMGGAGLTRQLHEAIQRRLELVREHVIGVSAKRCVLPGHVRGVRARLAEAAQLEHVFVRDAAFRQRRRQRAGVELRMPPRLRHGADIHQRLDALRLKECDELIEGACLMADGPDFEVNCYMGDRDYVDCVVPFGADEPSWRESEPNAAAVASAIAACSTTFSGW